jgi:hypothetical protein
MGFYPDHANQRNILFELALNKRRISVGGGVWDVLQTTQVAEVYKLRSKGV